MGEWHLVPATCLLPHQGEDICVKSIPQGEGGCTGDLTTAPRINQTDSKP
jgi:hypothetical protein